MKKDEFGISKLMNVMIMPVEVETRSLDRETETFNDGQPCPPYCDDRSIYNS